MSPDVRAALLRMTRDERLELLDEVWTLLRDDALPVPAAHARELRARLGGADADGEPGSPWAEARERLRQRV